MRTPQEFQSQLERFSAALQSGQMDLTQFGLRGGTGFSVAEFLAAIQAKADEARDERDGRTKGTDASSSTGVVDFEDFFFFDAAFVRRTD